MGRVFAPGAAGACGDAGTEHRPVRVDQMVGGREVAVNKVLDLLVGQQKAGDMVTAAGRREDPGHAGHNTAVAPAAHRPLVPVVHTMASVGCTAYVPACL